MTIETIEAPSTVLTEDQQELLTELQAMDMFRKETTYFWYMEQLKDLGIETVDQWQDRYQGCFDGREEKAGAEFAENLATECGEVPDDMPSWICIDWETSWSSNLTYDYNTIEIPAESGHGYINETHFFYNFRW